MYVIFPITKGGALGAEERKKNVRLGNRWNLMPFMLSKKICKREYLKWKLSKTGLYLMYESITLITTSISASRCSLLASRTRCSCKWSLMTSVIKPFTAPRIAEICCNTPWHSCSSSNIFLRPLTWPCILLTRAVSFFLSLVVCDIASVLNVIGRRKGVIGNVASNLYWGVVFILTDSKLAMDSFKNKIR